MKKYFPIFVLISLLTSCNNNVDILTHTVPGNFIDGKYVFPMNTLVTLRTFNENQQEEIAKGFDDVVISLSKEVDRYHDYADINNLKTINDSCGLDKEIKISDNLFELIKLSIDLTKLTEGKFNLAMGNIIDLYSDKLIEESSGRIDTLPEQSQIDDALLSIPSYVDVDKVIVLNDKDKTIKLNKYNDKNVVISLGAVAKGFVMDKAYDYLKSFNYPCLFDAGSSTMAMMGNNPSNKDGSWTVSFKAPYLSYVNESPLLCTVKLENDTFISTSGDYTQNYFYENENNSYSLMHHIIDPYKGISNNFIRSVSVISKNAKLSILDALTTTLFNCNSNEEVLTIIDKFESTYNCNLSFILSKPYNNSYSFFDVVVSKSFKDIMINEFNKDVKNVNTIVNY